MGIPTKMKQLFAFAYILTLALTFGLRNETSIYACPEYDVNFLEYDIAIVHASSWHKCGEICYNEESCYYWTWDTDDHECWLKTSDALLGNKTGVISGHYT